MALFLKSAAKLLYQTAKTCQYLKKKCKKVHFCLEIAFFTYLLFRCVKYPNLIRG